MNNNSKPWLLVVDDKKENIYAMERVLEGLDIKIQSVCSGEDALKAIINKRFFLILMDVNMPGMDGFETATLIRGNDNYKHIPLIYLTAKDFCEEDHLFGYSTGAVDYIYKPVNSNILNAKIKVFLDLYNKTEALSDRIDELNVYDQMVAHDLRAPVTNIMSLISLLSDLFGEKIEDEAKELFEHVTKCGKRMSVLINDLLAYSTSLKKEDLKETIHFMNCFELSLFNLNALINAHSAVVNIDDSAKICVKGVSVKIIQLFQNIIGNALKYQKKGNTPIINIYGCAENKDLFELIIADNGIGFSPDKATKIFQPFMRLHGREEYEGSGIGLATCKRITDYHGWGIYAESNEGIGTKVHITIPTKSVYYSKEVVN